MNSASKLAAFVAIVAVTFGGALAVGAAVGPIDVGATDSHSAHGAATVDELPRGLATAQSGYRFVVDTTDLPVNTASTFAFRIVDEGGAAVTAFDELHERQLHLIVLSRNLVDYLHLHPVMDADGRWTVDLPALAPGSYRVFADFQPEGADNLTLGTDIAVAGTVDAIALPRPAAVDNVDGYTVTMTGTPAVGDEPLSFEVQRDGQTVHTDPYLGAAGHLVAIRAGDLAYLHVHPHDDDASPIVTFTGEFPSAGTYRLFLDFAHGGAVHTAAYTVVVPDTGTEGD